MPTPRPDTSVTADAVEKPGTKMSSATAASSSASSGRGVHQVQRSGRQLPHLAEIDAGAVVG